MRCADSVVQRLLQILPDASSSSPGMGLSPEAHGYDAGTLYTSQTEEALLGAVTDLHLATLSLSSNHTLLSSWLDGISNDENENERLFHEFKTAWNASIFSCVVIGAVLAVAVLAWPSVVASNIRRNLRVGAWRRNRAAYVSQVQLHTLAGVPGAFIGISVVAVILIPVVMALCVFCFVYNPLRVYLYDEWGSYIFAAMIGYALLMFVQEYLLGALQTDRDGNVKNLQSYSLYFAIMVFFHFLYGTVKAIFRFGMYVCYVLFVVLRMDMTVLPMVLRSADDIFLMFMSLMLYEVKGHLYHTLKSNVRKCFWSDELLCVDDAASDQEPDSPLCGGVAGGWKC
jgi:hypothetical protein